MFVHANTYIKHPSKIRLKNDILPMEQVVVRSVMLSDCWEGLYHAVDWTWRTCCLLLRCACVRSCILQRNKVVRRTQFHPETRTLCKAVPWCRAGSRDCTEELCLSCCCALMIPQPQNYVFFRSDEVWDCQSKFVMMSDVVFIPV